tara:strand:- start:1710 stop:1931 length:222 start_codon:yes stop_codon:yes gene_type:complete
MRDRTLHMEHVERWANFVRNNPDKWKKIHTQFIDSLFLKNKEVRERLLKQPSGKEKLKEIYDIKNNEGYSWLK